MSVEDESVRGRGNVPSTAVPTEERSTQAVPTAPPTEDEFFEGPPPTPRERGDRPPSRARTKGPAPRPTMRDRRAAGRLRARKVRRLVRHVEPWSVLKISLLFYFCLWAIMLIAGVLLWSAAVGSGTIDNIETFIEELFALETFEFDADQIFRACAVGGLVLVVAATGFNVLLAVLFNLISDLTGGVRVTVVEEETARPRPARRRLVAGTPPPRDREGSDTDDAGWSPPERAR